MNVNELKARDRINMKSLNLFIFEKWHKRSIKLEGEDLSYNLKNPTNYLPENPQKQTNMWLRFDDATQSQRSFKTILLYV